MNNGEVDKDMENGIKVNKDFGTKMDEELNKQIKGEQE